MLTRVAAPEGEIFGRVQVIDVTSYGEMLSGLSTFLKRANLIGHSAKNDVTKLRSSWGVEMSGDITCTMHLAKEILGPRVAWNPRTRCV